MNFEGWTIDARPKASRNAKGWDAHAVHFDVTLTAPNGATWTGEYSAGSAHPIAAARDARKAGGKVWQAFAKASGIRANMRDVDKAIADLGRYGARRTLWLDGFAKAYRPGLADVVGCLFADASGFEPYDSLREWVDSVGMDWDHPCDAVDAFEGCQRAARFLHAALRGEAYAAAEEWAADL